MWITNQLLLSTQGISTLHVKKRGNERREPPPSSHPGYVEDDVGICKAKGNATHPVFAEN